MKDISNVTQEKFFRMVNLLLVYGADPNQVGHDGYSPFLLVIKDIGTIHPDLFVKLINLLIQHGANQHQTFQLPAK